MPFAILSPSPFRAVEHMARLCLAFRHLCLIPHHVKVTNASPSYGGTPLLTMNQRCANVLECLYEMPERGRCFECFVQDTFSVFYFLFGL